MGFGRWNKEGRTARAVAAAFAAILAVPAAAADSFWGVPQVWELELGSHALDMPRADFADYACGTNGGPPSTPVTGWADYARCPAEPDGLREVQFRYDDQAEYEARAYHDANKIRLFQGTTLYGEAVILSALFDADGFLLGIRAVSDPRVPVIDRERAIALRNFLVARFDVAGWDCQDLPREEGDEALGGSFLKQRCEKLSEGRRLSVEGRYFRREGQYGIDPVTREPVAGLFVSETRFEMRLDGAPADRAARLAALAGKADQPTAAEVNRQRAIDCPGCDLAGMDLKRQNLEGANLAGANLAGANLHAADLDGANLAGADLTGANLNRADLRRANLSGAKADKALFFAAKLDGANLGGASLNEARMSEASLVRANLTGVTASALYLIGARLLSANLADASFSQCLFTSAQLNRANLAGASLITVDMSQTNLTDADLSGARIWGTDFFGSDMRGANLSRADVNGVRLTTALMSNVNTEGTVFEDVLR